MKFSVLLVIALTAQGCGAGNSPLMPTSSGCRNGFGLGPTVSGLTFPAQGPIDIKVGETTEFAVVLDPPRVEYCSTSYRSYEKFAYLKWEWNAPLVDTGVVLPPSDGPVELSISSCQCSLFGEPVWKGKSSTVVIGHWEQRAWLTASQTVTFKVTGIGAGSTRVSVFAYTTPPFGDLDGGDAAFGSIEIRVVR
jgi:hypothetical protein